MTFHPAIFERLLFPLNSEAYKQIQKSLDYVGENHVNFNISIKYNQPDFNIEKLAFSTDFNINLNLINKLSTFSNGNFLSLMFHQDNIINSFHVPLNYFLIDNNEEILKSENNYIYSYTLYIDTNSTNNQISNNLNPYIYIGITKKSWSIRYSSHCQNMIKKPDRLLYKALNGNFGKILEKKLIIEKAGLTEKEALEIEEKEVNDRSFNLLFPHGLNMIPSGNAGRNLFIKVS